MYIFCFYLKEISLKIKTFYFSVKPYETRTNIKMDNFLLTKYLQIFTYIIFDKMYIFPFN